MTAEELYDQALEEAGEDLVNLPVRQRITLYAGGGVTCDRWIGRRAAWILARRLAAVYSETERATA